jgi:uncharacterized protein (TIGR02300 family)
MVSPSAAARLQRVQVSGPRRPLNHNQEKPELGTKRLCASCGARFYDLLHSPITCPKCGTVLATADVSSSRVRVKATRESEREFERPATETSGAPFASPKDADGEADGEQVAGVLPEGEDDDELADEDLDGAVLIEDSDQEDGDVADVHSKEED